MGLNIRINTRQLVIIALFLWVTSVCVEAQNPPPPNPAQTDATRPPGTQTNTTIPPNARPTTIDPTAPPGVQTSPRTPLTPIPDRPTPYVPPTSVVSPTAPDATGQSGLPVPNLPQLPARPVPPLPDLTRLGVNSSDTIPMSLNDAIRRALENNNDIEVSRQDVRIAEAGLRALEGVYEPLFTINPQINNQVGAQQSTLGGASNGGTLPQTDITWDTNVNKLFSKGGGNYNFFFNNNRRTTSSTFNILNPVYSSSLGVQFTQPLWRDRSIDNNRRQILIQRKHLEQSDADFRRKTIDIISQVQRAYWDLVFAKKDLENNIANLNLTRENLRRVEAQIAAGASAPLSRAEVNTELANRESDVLLASQNVSVAENNLKNLIIKDPNAAEWTAQLNPTESPVFDATPLNLNDALAEARKNRPELQRLRLQGDINQVDIKYFANQTKPRVDLQATLALTGLAGTPVFTTTSGPIIGTSVTTNSSAFLLSQIQQIQNALNPILAPGNRLADIVVPRIDATTTNAPPNLRGGYLQDLENLMKFKTRSVVVGVLIQFPFKNKTAEANLAGARYQETQLQASTRLQEQAIEVDVRNAAQAVETSRRRVLSARQARENAELQLQGEQRLYQVGRSTTFLLFQRENELANARNQEIRAETDYNKALADLQRATSTTLRANNVVVQSEVNR